jgi:excinuclease ABC subunit C
VISVTKKFQDKLKKLPNRPGVYLFHGEEGAILYVGKAKSLKKRVASYFRHNNFASPRLRKLVDSIRDLTFIRTESEAEALIVESRLIKRYQPFFNVELKMGERYPYLKITNEAFPRLEITRHKGSDGAHYVGPFTRVGDLRQLLRLIERHFPLRTCKSDLSRGPIRERPCVRYSLGRCSGACAGMVTEAEYGERVADVLLLLQGNAATLVERLRQRMDRAAANLAFEEAARLRDTIRSLWRLSRQRLSSTLSHDLDRETWSVLLHLQDMLALPTIPWRIDGFDISHFAGRETYGVAVVFEQGLSNPSLYRRFAVKSLEGIDDFRALQEVVGRRYRRSLEGEEPLPQLIVIDGGPIQLEFALKALTELGLEEIPIVSLAKRDEQLFLPHREKPIELPRSDSGLQLLQRVRDESHRFAISSHRSGRDRRLRRSVLEDVPGVGKKRAAHLLTHFGSVQNIASLEPEELTALPGIGPEMARRIIETLREEKM